MHLRPRRAVAGALLATVILVMSAGAPPAVRAIGPLPECRIDDIMTVPRGYDDWSVTLVDWLLRVERTYRPPDLVPVTDAGIAGGGLIREVAIDDLRAMAAAAARNGTPIGVWSPYRSYREQVRIFGDYVSFDGYRDAITYSHRPGHSEHQLGLGVDFMTAGGGNPLIGDWGATPAGAWMRENSWKFGWINSYPLETPGTLWSDKICFTYEPWHYRYLGREIARKVHRSGLTIREYLWKHHTMVNPRTGEPISTATPTPSATPSPSPEVTPTPVPSPTTTGSPLAATPSASPDEGGASFLGVGLRLDAPALAALFLAALVVLLIPIALMARRAAARR